MDISTERNEIVSTLNNSLEDIPARSSRLKCTWKAPAPNWPLAFSSWGGFWEFHIYFFGICFVLLALHSLVCFLLDVTSRFVRRSSNNEDRQKASPLSISLHGLILTSTTSRSINLLADPYGTNKVLPCPLGPVFWSLGWPGICCAFSVLLLVLLETTRLSLAPPRFQRPAVLAAIIVPSMLYVLIADMLVAYGGMKNALLVCQVMFVVWGSLLCFGFSQVWFKINQNLVSSTQDKTRDNSRLRKLNIILISCAVIGMALTLINLYAITATRSVKIRPYFVQPGPWMAFQTGQRILEVLICTLILVSQNRSSRWKKTGIGIGDGKNSSVGTRSDIKTVSSVPDAQGGSNA